MVIHRCRMAFIVCLVSAFLSACGGSAHTQKKSSVVCGDFERFAKIAEEIMNQSEDESGSDIYLLFVSSFCETCPQLVSEIQEINLKVVIHVMNADFTPNFLLSNEIGVRGAPTLVLFQKGEPKHGWTGRGPILQYIYTLEQK